MMKKYNIAFVGMGSIGKRHLRNVCQCLEEQGNTCSIDLYRSSMARELPEDILSLIDYQYLYFDDVSKNYDIVFITNPTSLHLETALKFREHTESFFIEKPVFDVFSIDDEVISRLDEIPSYVACPLRYHPVLQYVKHYINLSEVISVRAISSSYLPDWRPGQDYRQTYSAHAQLGGGVDIDLIHEWDYLSWLFGLPTECLGIVGRFSNLEIDSNDTAIYIARNAFISYELHLDYYGRKAQRVLDIFTQEDTVHCDLIEGSIAFLKEGRTIHFNCERNNYQMAEIKHYLDIVEGVVENDSNVKHGVNVLKLTKSII